MTGTIYTIRSVTDFLAIPPERRKVALREFGTWLRLSELYREAIGPALHLPDAFKWIDDDEGEAHICMSVDDEKILSVTMKMGKGSA